MYAICSKEMILLGPTVWGGQKIRSREQGLSALADTSTRRMLRERYSYFTATVKLVGVKLLLLKVKRAGECAQVVK